MKNPAPFLLVFSLFLLPSFSFDGNPIENQPGIFECTVNGKAAVIKGIQAKFRTITGGYKQLSLSNDKFDSFVFINPSVQKFELQEKDNRKAYVRYIEPGTERIYKPLKGYVEIQTLDLEKGVISGVFEMELINHEGAEKKIIVKNGKFVNIPIIKASQY
jgi:hypothetical protein